MTPKQIADEIVSEYLGVTFSRPGDAPEWLRKRIAMAMKEKFAELWAVADAASYCYRHNKIDRGAVLFTKLDEKLKALKEGPR